MRGHGDGVDVRSSVTTHLELAGRTALVTGATSGIGRAIALELADHGADVIVHGRDPARGTRLVDEIVERGARGRFIAADLFEADEAMRLAADAGEIDMLVNNAGIWDLSTTPNTSAESFDRQFAINTRAPFLLVSSLAPSMAERGFGWIVNITSTAAASPAPVGAAYRASKAATELLTRSWCTEFGPRGVRVNAVAPGPVRSSGTVEMMGAEIEALGQANIRGRVGEPQEIADIVLYLVSERSTYINGAVVVASGGLLSTVRS
jgi:NAD(P)-dependent dehydrogenase (short-subunit alcohol dehydrogenase family)